MKTVRITTTLKVSDEFYDSELKSIKKDIESGQTQRELKRSFEEEHGRGAVVKVKALFEIIQ